MALVPAIVTALLLTLSLLTVYELWARRAYILRDDLREEERSLAWRVVIFLLVPLAVLVDMRATVVATDLCGGWIKELTWGGWWFRAIPQALASQDCLLPVLFAGVAAQFVLALCLLPSLLFRPHPFVATVITYLFTTIFAINLIVDPLAGLVGAGSSRWELTLSSAPQEQVAVLLAGYLAVSVVLLLCARNRRLRLWLAELSRPHVGEQLRIAMSEAKAQPGNEFQTIRLAILLDRAGMRRQASTELRRLNHRAGQTTHGLFLEGYLFYRKGRYRKSKIAFEKAASEITTDNQLRAAFLAAAGCAAFAAGEYDNSLNFAERALEFDDLCVIARLVKVDVFMRQGNKKEAGEEVMGAIRSGLDLDMEDKIPIDPEMVLRCLTRIEKQRQSQSREKTAAA